MTAVGIAIVGVGCLLMWAGITGANIWTETVAIFTDKGS